MPAFVLNLLANVILRNGSFQKEDILSRASKVLKIGKHNGYK
jgi:hypothetical protein